MWRTNFLPWVEKRELAYRLGYLKLSLGLICLMLMLQGSAYFYYQDILQRERASLIKIKKLPKKLVTHACDPLLPRSLILRAILLSKKGNKIIIQNDNNQLIVWQSDSSWKNSCWKIERASVDEVILKQTESQEIIVWKIGEQL